MAVACAMARRIDPMEELSSSWAAFEILSLVLLMPLPLVPESAHDNDDEHATPWHSTPLPN
jgi:hypothetical protein